MRIMIILPGDKTDVRFEFSTGLFFFWGEIKGMTDPDKGGRTINSKREG